MRVSCAICVFALMAGSAVAAVPAPPRRPADFPTAVAPPLPPPRPADLSPPPAPPPLAERPENPAACDAWLASGVVESTRRAPIASPNGCGVDAPVALDAVILPDKRRIPIEPPPVLRCDFAAEAARWITQDLVPSLEAGGERVVRLAGVGGYECRTRDREPGARLSEHAYGDAIDLTSVVFTDGRVFSLASRANDLVLASKLRASACELFSTVLGPGADGAHEKHIHLDLEPRRHSGKICEWDLR